MWQSYMCSVIYKSEFKEEQANYKFVNDSEAVIINAWCIYFLNMPQKCCSLHFLKNIYNKLWYYLLHRPTKNQVKKILSIFNRSIIKYSLFDLPANKVKENEDKILYSM
jgi:hypothetical protein